MELRVVACGSKGCLKVIIIISRTWMCMVVAMITSIGRWRFSDMGVFTL